MTDPVVLSGSSVATFMRCEQQWFYAYIERIKSPPTVRQALGVATHGAIEVNMAQKVMSKVDMPESDVLDAFDTQYSELIDEVEGPDHDPSSLDNTVKAKDDGYKLLRLHHRRVAPKIQPVWVEKPVQFAINDVPYSGVIDLVDDRDRIRDWKTSGRRPQANNQSYLLNMTGYALAYRQETGKTESEVVLDYLVRTQTPQYLPIASGGPIDNQAIVTFSHIVSKVAQRVKSGDFLPTGLANNACSWCGYKKVCPYYREGVK